MPAEEWSYYVKEYDRVHGIKSTASLAVPEHCSAFVATGSYTKDGKVVIAHNNWTNYLDGERWTIIFDIVPAKGNRMLMDGLPGVIHSADDFVTNSAGIVITETTISHFSGYDPAGIPEFVRARKAAQYSASIDDFARIMKEGNNGGYANTWLIADTGKNEIGRLELGLKNVTLERKKDGYFVGSNFPINEKLIREETDFDPHDMSLSANARHVRWEQLMAENKGKIDLASAQRFLADHYDTYENKEDADERSLDGHIDLSPRGTQPWQPPFGMAGAVQNKATDASLAAEMSFSCRCGSCLWHGFQGRRSCACAPGVFLAEGSPAGHELSCLDKVQRGEVAGSQTQCVGCIGRFGVAEHSPQAFQVVAKADVVRAIPDRVGVLMSTTDRLHCAFDGLLESLFLFDPLLQQVNKLVESLCPGESALTVDCA